MNFKFYDFGEYAIKIGFPATGPSREQRFDNAGFES